MNIFKINNTEFKVSAIKTDKLIIKSHPKDYEVIFDSFFSVFTENDVLLIDKTVQKLYDINHTKLISIDAKEENKSIDTVLNICDKLLSFGFDKGNNLIVIGGGIIQDIGAFTAKMYKRGINWTYVPTTLLSQCDSCIGGKTALNFKNYKNQLALFSAPNKVIIDTNFLTTLKDEDIISGYGEIIKLFLIGGKYYTNNIKEFDLKTSIFHSLSIKKAVIEQDEFESDERKAMNYGHSFGHAIEAVSGYKIPHGEAVLMGIEIINKLFTNSNEITKIVNTFTNLNKIKDIKIKDILEAIKTDKKVINEIITLVVLQTPGNTIFHKQKIDNNLGDKLHEIFTD